MTTRRRGEELESALLDAAWQQLVDEGYSAFTFEAVAQRAGTSKPVLYRRWRTREEMMVAALKHYRAGVREPIPETGSLRDDVLALLRRANVGSSAMIAVMSARLGSYFEEAGSTPAELRRQMLGDGYTSVSTLVDRAVARGELAEPLPERVADVAFDLFRHEAMMTLSTVPDDVVVAIVDDVFMPLVRAYSQD